MLPTDDLRTRLRKMINETIPAGGSETDTNFSNQELDDLLAPANNLYIAASMCWTIKAGLLKERVENYKVGQESYEHTTLKDMVEFALKMSTQYAEIGQQTNFTGETKSSYILKMQPPEIL